MKKVLISILFVCMPIVFADSSFANSGWLIYHERAFKGKVIDTDTRKPIEGVVVVAIYHIRKYGIGAGIMSDSLAVDAKEVLTDEKGEFYIPSHTFFNFWPFASGETTEFIIYKPGYSAFPSFDYLKYIPNSPLDVDLQTQADLFKKGVIVELMELKTKEERIENFRISIGDSIHRKLPLLNKAINEERKRFGFEEIWK